MKSLVKITGWILLILTLALMASGFHQIFWLSILGWIGIIVLVGWFIQDNEGLLKEIFLGGSKKE